MIVKKIKNPKKSASKSVRVGRLTDYIIAPENQDASEKCLYAGARGFLSDDYVAQRAEMLALAQEAVRSPDTINHYVLSWQEGERPSAKQVEEAVDIFLKELELERHQAIYGLHADTDNVHLHIAVNRVDPVTLKVIKPNRGFDIEAAHRAIARIEEQQGWQREAHGRYRVEKDGKVERDQQRRPAARQPEQAKRDMEQRTGEKSAERIAIEMGAPLIKAATSWQTLHRALAEHGMRYERTGSGAVLFVNDVGVKASRADREASLGKLEKRLGAFEPSSQNQVAARAPEAIHAATPDWQHYIAGRHAHVADRSAAYRALKARQENERKALMERHRHERADVLQGRWTGRGELRNALESTLAAQRAVERAEMRERQRNERAILRERFRPFPDLERWLREQQHPELAQQWRYRAMEVPTLRGDNALPARPRDIRDYVAQIDGENVHYFRHGAREAGDGAAFTDKGGEIAIHAWREQASVLAALQLAEQKWATIEVKGNAQFKALCVALAVEHDIALTNPELQTQIVGEQQRQLALRMKVYAPAQPAKPAQPARPDAGDKPTPAKSTVDLPALYQRSINAYARHYQDIVRRQGGKAPDPSRVDAMVAVRMRATGHTRQQVEMVLQHCAPPMRQNGEARDWARYASQTAAYAYGATGERQLEALRRYWPQWEKLEGKKEVSRQRDGGMTR